MDKEQVTTPTEPDPLDALTVVALSLLLRKYARQIDRELRQLHEAISEAELDADNRDLYQVHLTNRLGGAEYTALDGLRELADAMRGSADTLIKDGLE